MWFPNKDKLHHVYIIHNNTRGCLNLASATTWKGV